MPELQAKGNVWRLYSVICLLYILSPHATMSETLRSECLTSLWNELLNRLLGHVILWGMQRSASQPATGGDAISISPCASLYLLSLTPITPRWWRIALYVNSTAGTCGLAASWSQEKLSECVCESGWYHKNNSHHLSNRKPRGPPLLSLLQSHLFNLFSNYPQNEDICYKQSEAFTAPRGPLGHYPTATEVRGEQHLLLQLSNNNI